MPTDRCPTCGCPVRAATADEGTAHYTPLSPVIRELECLREEGGAYTVILSIAGSHFATVQVPNSAVLLRLRNMLRGETDHEQAD